MQANDNWKPVGFYSVRAVVMNFDTLSEAMDAFADYHRIVGYSVEQNVAGQKRCQLSHRVDFLKGRVPSIADAIFCICSMCDDNAIDANEFMQAVAGFCLENSAQELLCVAEDLIAMRQEYEGREE